MGTDETIEKHYYSRGSEWSFQLAVSRADIAADLQYPSWAHDHPYGRGEIPCTKRCRKGRVSTPTIPPADNED